MLRHLRLWLSGLALLFCLILLGAGAGRATFAQELPPRPTPSPVATTVPSVVPTTETDDDDADDDADADDDDQTTIPMTSRITGTVIDFNSGVPMPGVAVYVGGVRVESDANGNYLRDNLPAGSYSVWAGTQPGLISAVETVQLVELDAGETVVLHLHVIIRP